MKPFYKENDIVKVIFFDNRGIVDHTDELERPAAIADGERWKRQNKGNYHIQNIKKY